MTTIYLIRHAEADGNLYRRVHGQFDGLVTARGLRQIQQLRDRFLSVSLDAVYSSDLFRARLTALALTEPKGLSLMTDPQLREIDLGQWEDQTWGDIARLDPDGFAAFNDRPFAFTAPGGESMAQAARRVLAAVQRIASRHPGSTIAIVTHGIVLRSLLYHWAGKAPEQLTEMEHCDNTAVSKVLLEEDGAARLCYCGDGSHLTEETSTLMALKKTGNGGSKERLGKNVWFQPAAFPRDQELFLSFRKDAWQYIHGSMRYYDPDAFLRDAVRCMAQHPKGLQLAMLGEQVIGMLQIDSEFPDGKSLHLPFVYLRDGMRGGGLGIQLIGEAQSIARSLKKSQLRLRCSTCNHSARRFYERLGFSATDLEQAAAGPLLIMTKSILPVLP